MSARIAVAVGALLVLCAGVDVAAAQVGAVGLPKSVTNGLGGVQDYTAPANVPGGATQPFAANGFMVLESGQFHIENGLVRVCADLRSQKLTNNEVGCFAVQDKALAGVVKEYRRERSLSLEQLVAAGFPNRSARFVGFAYNPARHEVIVYYRLD